MPRALKLTPQTGKILRTWLPLAASWLLMGTEMPAVTAVIARLAHPEISLAAHGSIAFPISLIIESPIIMFLSASVALCSNMASYKRIFRIMMVTSFCLTILHVVVAFTPLYDVLVRQIVGAPEEIVEPARVALQIMTPWTWSIAYRRFQQGVLIRFGHPSAVSIGTVIRLLSGISVLALGLAVQTIPGYVIGPAAQAVGTFCESMYAGLRVRPVIKYQLKTLPYGEAIPWKNFFSFYLPLVLTSILNQAWQPFGSAAISRMPQALESLATFSVVSGLVFMFRSIGFAYNEVVVALLGQEGSSAHLRKFAFSVLRATIAVYLLAAVTPLAYLWFTYVSGIAPNLVHIARISFWLALPMAATSVLQSWFQGAILYGRQTRAIPESTIIFLVTALFVLGSGIVWGRVTGLFVGISAFSLANVMQTLWLWNRSRGIIAQVRRRDQNKTWEPI